MKKTLLSIAIISITFMSCKKEDKLIDNFTRELSLEAAQISLPNSGGEINITRTLNQSSNADYYVDGELKYMQNNQNVAIVDFGQGEENSIAELTIDGNITDFELKNDDSYYDGKKSKYKQNDLSNDCQDLSSGCPEIQILPGQSSFSVADIYYILYQN